MIAIPKIPAYNRKICRGALIVQANADAELGVSNFSVPKGTVGFVLTQARGVMYAYFPGLGLIDGVEPAGAVNKELMDIVGRQPY